MQSSTETKRLKTKDGTIAYYCLGKLHNVEGHALIPQGDEKKAEYWLFGFKYSKDEWQRRIKNNEGVPFHKTSVGKASGARV